MLKLSQLRVGKVDGKHEYLTPVDQREREVFDAFLVPDSVDPSRMNNGDTFFVAGFRGTGKTSLLRWHAEQKRASGASTDFILFKSDLTEAQRLHISTEVGISWTDIDPGSMEISQDFKDAWSWFILHKIGEEIQKNIELYGDDSKKAIIAIKLLGLDDNNTFKKAIGFMPKLEGARVKIRANTGFFEAELGGDFRSSGESGDTTFSALTARVLRELKGINFPRQIFIYFDELEVFYHNPEQHKRDQRMVRDLLFSIASINDQFRIAGKPIHILAAVRSEVVDAMGSLGQEVDRLVHDRCFLISWHHANRSMKHPLMRIVAAKIKASEKIEGISSDADPLTSYFPDYVSGEPLDGFLLDKSFYKPRDIVWRLSIAQMLFPNEERFSGEVLRETEVDYSRRLWDEVRYEMSAIYSDEEVDSIEGVISGGAASFELRDIEIRFDKSKNHSRLLNKLLERRSVREILSDLYRLGAIGNSFRAGPTGTQIRNRWSFRGDPKLLLDKRMVIHPALIKRLSVVAKRRRGV